MVEVTSQYLGLVDGNYITRYLGDGINHMQSISKESVVRHGPAAAVREERLMFDEYGWTWPPVRLVAERLKNAEP